MTQTTPKIFVFVLMPFDTKFDDIYELGIKAACSDAGAYCERVDEQIFEESILNRIYNQISKADLLIADMTGRNHNVFYEVGYAHALGKRVFLLTQSSDDIPFDLKHYPHIVYGGQISELKSELTKRIRWAIENPEDVEKYLKTRNDNNPKLFPISRVTFKAHWKIAIEKTGIYITPQKLRYWFCSEMGQLGIQDRYVDAFCGRVPKSILARHYSDFKPESLKRIYEKADLKMLSN